MRCVFTILLAFRVFFFITLYLTCKHVFVWGLLLLHEISLETMACVYVRIFQQTSNTILFFTSFYFWDHIYDPISHMFFGHLLTTYVFFSSSPLFASSGCLWASRSFILFTARAQHIQHNFNRETDNENLVWGVVSLYIFFVPLKLLLFVPCFPHANKHKRKKEKGKVRAHLNCTYLASRRGPALAFLCVLGW